MNSFGFSCLESAQGIIDLAFLKSDALPDTTSRLWANTIMQKCVHYNGKGGLVC